MPEFSGITPGSTKNQNIFSNGGGYGGSKEKTISCSVCLNRIPAS